MKRRRQTRVKLALLAPLIPEVENTGCYQRTERQFSLHGEILMLTQFDLRGSWQPDNPL